MPKFFRILISLCILAAGLVVAACMLVVTTAVLALWGARAAWLKLTGRAVPPFKASFRFSQNLRHPGAFADVRNPRKAPAGDVIDVDSRQLP